MSKNKGFSNTSAQRYSLALYELSSEANSLVDIEKHSSAILRLIEKNKDFNNLIKDPTENQENLISVINKISETFKVNDLLKNFMTFLIKKRRFFYLEKILKSFIEICSEKRGEIKAEIQSAKEESEVLSAVVSLKEAYENKPYDLVEVSSGFRIQLNQDYSKDIAKLWEVKPLRLSRATLETLSIITYMQPVTRGDIEDIRGVNVATNVIKVLMDQGWIKIKGYRDVPGRPALFITTQKFLDDFSMKTLDDLPVLPDLPEIENISPELSLQEDSIEQEAPK